MYWNFFTQIYIGVNIGILAGLAVFLPYYGIYKFGEAVYKKVKKEMKDE